MRSVPASIVRRVPLAWYLVAALALSLALAWRAQIREAEARGRAEAEASDLAARLDSATVRAAAAEARADSLTRHARLHVDTVRVYLTRWHTRTDTTEVPVLMAMGDSLAAACESSMEACEVALAAQDSARAAQEARYAALEAVRASLARRLEAERGSWLRPALIGAAAGALLWEVIR